MGLILIVVLIAVVVLAAQQGSVHRIGTPVTSVPADTPLDILDKRYVRGEIDRTEYLERKRELAS